MSDLTIEKSNNVKNAIFPPEELMDLENINPEENDTKYKGIDIAGYIALLTLHIEPDIDETQREEVKVPTNTNQKKRKES